MVTPLRVEFEAKHGPITQGKTRKLWKAYYPTIATQTRGQKPGYGPTGLRDEQHKDGKNARQIVPWLEQKSYGKKPFFMACGIHKPHGPFLAPDAYFERYPKDALRLSDEAAPSARPFAPHAGAMHAGLMAKSFTIWIMT